MQCATRGIVLNYIKYRETSLIVRVFTEAFGKQSYLVKGVRTPRSKHPMALFQPFMPLDMLVRQARSGTLHYLVEAKSHVLPLHLFSDLKKATMAVFLTELFHKAVSEAEENAKLFKFLLQAALALDALQGEPVVFYIHFILSLAHHLGVGCSTAAEMNTQLVASGYPELPLEELTLLDQLIQKSDDVVLNRHQARNLTMGLVRFLQLHIETIDRLNSLKVLQSMNE